MSCRGPVVMCSGCPLVRLRATLSTAPAVPIRMRFSKPSYALLGVLFASLTAVAACQPVSEQSPEASSSSGSADSSPSGSKNKPGKTPSPSGSPEPADDESAGGPNCADDPTQFCLGKVPATWSGPVQMQSASTPAGLLPCRDGTDPFPAEKGSEGSKGPLNAANVFFESVVKSSPDCRGCRASLQLGTCSQPKWGIKDFDASRAIKCGERDPSLSLIPVDSRCQSVILRKDIAPTTAVGLFPPEISSSSATCEISEKGSANILPPRAPTHFRFCRAEKVHGNCEPSEDCGRYLNLSNSPNTPFSCIYKEGIHHCPKSVYDAKRLTLYSGIEDTRSCGACNLVHTRGAVSCWYDLRLGRSFPRCEEDTPRDVFSVCLTQSEIQDSEKAGKSNSLLLQPPEPIFGGMCHTTDWGPQGDVTAVNPLTVCCEALFPSHEM